MVASSLTSSLPQQALSAARSCNAMRASRSALAVAPRFASASASASASTSPFSPSASSPSSSAALLSTSARLHASPRTPPPTRQPTASSPPPPPPPSDPLPWDAYLRLRRSRRLAGLATTIPTTLLAGAAAGSYFLTLDIDPTAAPGGLDPTFLYAGLTLACTGLGWLTGPTVGTSVWSLLHARHAAQIAHKDHLFYEHVRRNRVDPTRQTMQNPVPDYYGEKIGSLRQYRQWLRDQAAYRRKAAHGLEQDA